MNKKLMTYLDEVFSPYEDLHVVRELKEELSSDLQEKWSDLKNQGYNDETAYSMTVDSIGDISEIIESISSKTIELKQMVGRDFSKIDLRDSDLKQVEVHEGKFNKSAMDGSDFSGSDLTNSSFQSSDLRNITFDGSNLTGAKLIKSALSGASFQRCVLNYTDFSYSDLSGICFANHTFEGTIFDKAGLKGTSFKNAVFRNVSFRHSNDVKKADFDGATMDKLTYAVLKGSKANLKNVTVI
ncbi:pentapeptide repeat-containing protein [Virgibacillus salexigens]|uniref:Low-complexity protein n=1 Tax=Virgibacillus kapii TaxID=1638645 RepID=A0ABQ2DEJ0_9BACI|nr:pentapeptide repeat-containing protein [Virgibacillus kapii]GGJ55111.1 hypothetical protein GCM10007111_16750 [Virgibacillus kapii]